MTLLLKGVWLISWITIGVIGVILVTGEKQQDMEGIKSWRNGTKIITIQERLKKLEPQLAGKR